MNLRAIAIHPASNANTASTKAIIAIIYVVSFLFTQIFPFNLYPSLQTHAKPYGLNEFKGHSVTHDKPSTFVIPFS